MSIENITGKILQEANDAALSLIENAENQSLNIINEANKKAEDILSKESEKFLSEAEILKQRKTSAAQLEARKMLLGAKQDAINKSFDKALEKLKKMPEDKYINFLADEILKSSVTEGELILNDHDSKNIGEKLVKIVNDKLHGSKIVLSKKTIDASGGFVLKNGNIGINSTFDTILSSIKDELTFEVANMIFK